MIITQTPFRVSFLGGGTDYPEYFEQHGGAVLGTAIDASAYLTATRFRSKLFDYSIRLSYRETECVNGLEEIRHAPFRECLRYCGIERDVEIHYAADLPSFSGMGSSSSFVVGLLHALHTYRERKIEPTELAYQAIHLERDILGDCVGCQDQVFAAVGGLNVIEFRAVDDIEVHPVRLSAPRTEELNAHLLAVYTGVRRPASEVAKLQLGRLGGNVLLLRQLRAAVDEGYAILTGSRSLAEFGSLMDRSWRLKAQLDASVSNAQIDLVYQRGLEAGAFGGKLLGAGGGGFLLFVAPPEKHDQVRDSLHGLEVVPVRVNAPGSRVLNA